MSKENSQVNEEDVRHIASLARVDIDDEKIDEYIDQFDKILDRFERLDDVDPEEQVDDELENVLRPDIIEESLSQEQALENAEKTKDGYFEGPSVN